MRRESLRIVFGVLVAIGLIGALVPAVAVAEPKTAPLAGMVVVADGEDPSEVAGDHGISIDRRYALVFNGFIAGLTNVQLTSLRQDDRVLSVSADRTFQRQAASGKEPVTQVTS